MTSRMCETDRPPGVPGVDMPPAGNRAGIGPRPTLKTTSRMRPSQKVGTDQSVREVPEAIRSSRLPGRQPLRMPSHMPAAMEITVDTPISRMVGQSLLAMSEDTGCWNCHE